jgi:ABC-type phosphate transport system ATPase subunit
MSKVEAQRPSGAPVAETDKVVIRNLNFYYGQTHALRSVNLNLCSSAHRAAASRRFCGF